MYLTLFAVCKNVLLAGLPGVLFVVFVYFYFVENFQRTDLCNETHFLELLCSFRELMEHIRAIGHG